MGNGGTADGSQRPTTDIRLKTGKAGLTTTDHGSDIDDGIVGPEADLAATRRHHLRLVVPPSAAQAAGQPTIDNGPTALPVDVVAS